MKKEEIKLNLISSHTGEFRRVKWSTSKDAMIRKIKKYIKEDCFDTFEYVYKDKTTSIDNEEVLLKLLKEVYIMDAETEEEKAKIAGTILSNKKSHILKCKNCGQFFDSCNKLTLKGNNGLQGTSECPKCGTKIAVIKTDQTKSLHMENGTYRRNEPKKRMSKKDRRRAKNADN